MSAMDFARTPRGRKKRADTRSAARLVILHDHARLPGRFFGRLTAGVKARLGAR
jgi:hypothetical protein